MLHDAFVLMLRSAAIVIGCSIGGVVMLALFCLVVTICDRAVLRKQV